MMFSRSAIRHGAHARRGEGGSGAIHQLDGLGDGLGDLAVGGQILEVPLPQIEVTFGQLVGVARFIHAVFPSPVHHGHAPRPL